MPVASAGTFLINANLPPKYRISGELDKKKLKDTLTSLAKEDPDTFIKVVQKLKRVGDTVATYSGISVGLDDIEPQYSKRDKYLNDTINKIKKTNDPTKRQQILLNVQNKLMDVTKKHPGDMGLMVRSGGRGNAAQLMKTVTTPVAATDWSGNIIPWFIKRSYAEGLKPSEAWVAGIEARKNTVLGTTSVVEPGDINKVVTQTMGNILITTDDCGTMNGIGEDPCSPNIIDRFLAQDVGAYKRNTLITTQIASSLCSNKRVKRIVVRSPITCEANSGVCQKCFGLDTRGNLPSIGTNVGMRGAHALAEPLTQAMLSSKHAAGLVEKKTKELTGFKGVDTFLRIPKKFSNAAVLSSIDGTITKIEKAPQGGNYVHVNSEKFYVPPTLDVIVKQGDVVEAGDPLSDGVPKPDEVVKYKGIGLGRKYYVDTLYKTYKNSVVDVDKRHIELLAKAHLSHAKVEDDPNEELLRGDIIDYNSAIKYLQKNSKEVPLKDSIGKILAKSYYEYMAGTKITPKIQKELSKLGLTKVEIAINAPKFEFIMKPITHAPLLNPDWMARLGHRYLKGSILDAAMKAETSNIHGVNPIPAFVYGVEMTTGAEGTY